MKIEDRIEALEKRIGQFVDRTIWLEKRASATYVRVQDLETTLCHPVKDDDTVSHLSPKSGGKILREKPNKCTHRYKGSNQSYKDFACDDYCRDCGKSLQEGGDYD